LNQVQSRLTTYEAIPMHPEVFDEQLPAAMAKNA
jgi:hypothetical protein